MSYNRNFFDSLEGGGSGDDWNIDELDEIQRMLESDGSDMPLPEEQSAESPEEQPAETAGKARSGGKKAGKSKSAGGSKTVKAKKTAAKKEKPAKPRKKDKNKKEEEPEDSFGQLPAIKGGKTKSLKDPEETAEPEIGEKGKKKKTKEKREKPPKPPKDPEKVKQNKITAIVFLVIIMLIVLGATVGGYMVTHNGTTLPKVYVGDIFVGGMSSDEVNAVLEENNWDARAYTALRVKMPAIV